MPGGDARSGGQSAGAIRSPAPLRADKMTLAALEATLALYDDEETARREVPVLRMLTEEPGSIEARARRVMALAARALRAGADPR